MLIKENKTYSQKMRKEKERNKMIKKNKNKKYNELIEGQVSRSPAS